MLKLLGIPLRRFKLPIECEISVKDNRPKILASFNSSALQNCRLITADLDIIAFYIPADHWTGEPENSERIYESCEAYTSELFRIVKL